MDCVRCRLDFGCFVELPDLLDLFELPVLVLILLPFAVAGAGNVTDKCDVEEAGIEVGYADVDVDAIAFAVDDEEEIVVVPDSDTDDKRNLSFLNAGMGR